MKVLALSFSRVQFTSEQEYKILLERFLSSEKWDLVVLPAHSALFFASRCGFLGAPSSFGGALAVYLQNSQWLNQVFLNLHQQVARSLKVYLVPGTMPLKERGNVYFSSFLFNRKGVTVGMQKQTHLSSWEKGLKLARGQELKVFNTEFGRLGIIIGTDSWYPETGRILGLLGVDLICHPGALPKKYNHWHQMAGMWQQVQQNQFFCIESQLNATLGEVNFSAPCAIHAPCEMTINCSGYLALGKAAGEALSADLHFHDREKVLADYPVLSFLNPKAYRHYYATIRAEAEGEEEEE